VLTSVPAAQAAGASARNRVLILDPVNAFYWVRCLSLHLIPFSLPSALAASFIAVL
jgi:hypothetical protein